MSNKIVIIIIIKLSLFVCLFENKYGEMIFLSFITFLDLKYELVIQDDIQVGAV